MNNTMTNCMKCGSANISSAQFCSSCSAPCGVPCPEPQPASQTNSNRAMIALVLGIVSIFVCGFTAIPDAILAWMEMQAVKERRVPQANGGMAKTALWINLAALVLTVFGCLGFGLLGGLSMY